MLIFKINNFNINNSQIFFYKLIKNKEFFLKCHNNNNNLQT